MKILLDECLPHALREMIPGHEVFTVGYMRFTGTRNGLLMQRAASVGFDALVTLDAGIATQHNPSVYPLAVVVLHARSADVDDLLPLIPGLCAALNTLKARKVVHVGLRNDRNDRAA